MNTIRHLAGCLSLAVAAPVAARSAPPPLIPMPAAMVPQAGTLTIATGAEIAVPAGDHGAAIAARLLAARVAQERGLSLSIGTANPRVAFVRDPAVTGAEAYRLTISPAEARITASGDSGLLYGAMTLAQLLSPDAAYGRPVTLAAMTIMDQPRFVWRGVMLDVARHFLPLSAIRTTIDQMAAHKLNTLHLHLTDDQGWRIEIKRYPDLARIGGYRTPPSAGGAPGAPVGGYYTQDELKALVAYAADRGVTIVPELDLPGHMQAAVAAYPDVGVFGDRPPVSHDWGVNPYLLMPDAHGIAFIEHVLDEVMAIFPSRFVHLGGDEAIKDQWQRSPAVQARMAALGIKTEDGMQSWLIDTLGRYLADHGRRLIGWDEILEGGLPPSASVMSWRGDQGAVDAANQGHDVVLAPAPTLYLDSLQSDRGDEPPGRLSIVTLADLYRYDPLPAALDPGKAAHVLGAEVTAFSEYLVTPAEVQHAMFPRLDAFADIAWSPRAARDWTGFLDRLQPQRLRYARAGVAAADSAFAADFALTGSRGAVLRGAPARVAIRTQTGYGTIRYTLDGSAPTARARAYVAPVTVPMGAMLRAAAFAPDGSATAADRRFDATAAAIGRWSSSDLDACPHGKLGLRVPLTADAREGTPAYNVNLFDTCTMAHGVPQEGGPNFTIDVARLARHYGLAHDEDKVIAHYAVTPHGELVVRSGGCDGRIVATFPLPDPATAPDRFRVTGALPAGTGDADICMLFTAPIAGPYYTVGAFTVSPTR